jgi:hypothetical protein
MRLSASQIDTAQTCLRAWWFSKVAKLKQPFARNLLVGEVGHGVCERYLLNQPLYPAGWEYPVNRFTGEREKHHITTTEQALVKALITKAIAEGVLKVEPDGEVEKEFNPVVDNVEGEEISLLGFIDYIAGNVIIDHKFTSAAKYYGVAKLDKALAMNLYAYAGYELGMFTDPTCWIRYNLFIKSTEKPEVLVKLKEKSKEEVYNYYEQHIQSMYKPMVLAKRNCKTWDKVDSAMDKGCAATACMKYGGCPYLDICLGKVTVDEYRARFEVTDLNEKRTKQSAILEGLQNATNTNKKEKKMSGFLSQLKNAPEGTEAPTPAPEPKAPAPVQKEEVQAPAAEVIKAPWHFEGCPMCARYKFPVKGMNDKGEPCNICVITTNQMKESDPSQPVLDDYDVDVSKEGKVTWTKKGAEEEAPVVETAPVKEEPVVREQMDSKGGDTFDEEEFPEPPEPDAEDKPDVPLALDDLKIEQERMGFTLAYGPVRQRQRKSKKLGEANCLVHISELMEMVAPLLLAKANEQGAGKRDFFDLEYFLRRDLIRANVRAIAELVKNSTVECSKMVEASDEQVLAIGLERYANWIYGA